MVMLRTEGVCQKVMDQRSRYPGSTVKIPGVLSVTRSFHTPSAGSAEASTVNVACSSVPVSQAKSLTRITVPSSATSWMIWPPMKSWTRSTVTLRSGGASPVRPVTRSGDSIVCQLGMS